MSIFCTGWWYRLSVTAFSLQIGGKERDNCQQTNNNTRYNTWIAYTKSRHSTKILWTKLPQNKTQYPNQYHTADNTKWNCKATPIHNLFTY